MRVRNRNEVVWGRSETTSGNQDRPAPKTEKEKELLKHVRGQPPRSRFILEVK